MPAVPNCICTFPVFPFNKEYTFLSQGANVHVSISVTSNVDENITLHRYKFVHPIKIMLNVVYDDAMSFNNLYCHMYIFNDIKTKKSRNNNDIS
jgi:hypothetical protein